MIIAKSIYEQTYHEINISHQNKLRFWPWFSSLLTISTRTHCDQTNRMNVFLTESYWLCNNLDIALCCEYTEALKGHRMLWKIEICYLIRITYERKRISSGWLNNINVTHPDEKPTPVMSSGWHKMEEHVIRMTYHTTVSSGWLSRNRYLIRMSYDNVIVIRMTNASILMSSGWDSKFRFSTPRGGPSALPYEYPSQCNSGIIWIWYIALV